MADELIQLRRPVVTRTAALATSDVASEQRVQDSGGKFGAGVIRGVSVAETGPATGHGFDLDGKAIEQVTELGNAQPNGVKSRFTHPDMCHDGLGDTIGRLYNFRTARDGAMSEGTGKSRSLADLHFLKAADAAKVDHVRGLAKESPDSLALSMVFQGKFVKRVDAEGTPLVDEDGDELPPVARLTALKAGDVVDEGAANDHGLFGDSDPAFEFSSAVGDALKSKSIDDMVAAKEGDVIDDAWTTDFLVALATSPSVANVLAKIDAGNTRIELSEAGLDRVTGFLNRTFTRHGLGLPVESACVARALSRTGHLRKGSTMNILKNHDADVPSGGTGNPDPAAGANASAAVGTATVEVELKGADALQTAVDKLATVTNDTSEAAKLAERKRVADIRALAGTFPEHDLSDVVTKLCEGDFTLDQARVELFKAASDRQTKVQTVTVTSDERDKFRALAADAILLRVGQIGPRDDDQDIAQRAKLARESGLAGLGPQRLALLCLKNAGVRGADMMDADALFEAAMFQPVHGGAALAAFGHSTSDFPLILADSANKSLIQGFETAQRTWDIWCRVGDLSNFRTTKRIRLSESALLLERPEGAPSQDMAMNERGESITLANYARNVSYTRQMFVNDDLGAFMDLAQRTGVGAMNTIERMVYESLTSNSGAGPTMSDAVALFNAAHSNLNSGGSGAPTQALIEAMWNAMSVQTGIGEDGAKIAAGGPPRYFLARPGVATTIRAIIDAPFRGLTGLSNEQSLQMPQEPALRAATAIDVPTLGVMGENDWYGVADQRIAPSYEVAFLNGVRTPRTKQVIGTTVDGTRIVVDLDWAIFPTGGWEGINRNAGA